MVFSDCLGSSDRYYVEDLSIGAIEKTGVHCFLGRTAGTRAAQILFVAGTWLGVVLTYTAELIPVSQTQGGKQCPTFMSVDFKATLIRPQTAGCTTSKGRGRHVTQIPPAEALRHPVILPPEV